MNKSTVVTVAITLGILAILGRWGGPVAAPTRSIVGA